VGQSGHAPSQSGHGIHCDQLILRKISKIGATRCQILRLKCTEPAGGAYSAPSDPLAVFGGLFIRGGREKDGGEGNGEGKGRKGRAELAS